MYPMGIPHLIIKYLILKGIYKLISTPSLMTHNSSASPNNKCIPFTISTTTNTTTATTNTPSPFTTTTRMTQPPHLYLKDGTSSNYCSPHYRINNPTPLPLNVCVRCTHCHRVGLEAFSGLQCFNPKEPWCCWLLCSLLHY